MGCWCIGYCQKCEARETRDERRFGEDDGRFFWQMTGDHQYHRDKGFNYLFATYGHAQRYMRMRRWLEANCKGKHDGGFYGDGLDNPPIVLVALESADDIAALKREFPYGQSLKL